MAINRNFGGPTIRVPGGDLVFTPIVGWRKQQDLLRTMQNLGIDHWKYEEIKLKFLITLNKIGLKDF